MMNPRAKEKIILVILFLILCAVRFLRISFLKLEFSKIAISVCTKTISSSLWRLKARIVSPKSMPMRMKKKILSITLKLSSKSEIGRI